MRQILLVLTGFVVLAWPLKMSFAVDEDAGVPEEVSQEVSQKGNLKQEMVRPMDDNFLRNRIDNLEREIRKLEDDIRYLEDRSDSLDRRVDDLRQRH